MLEEPNKSLNLTYYLVVLASLGCVLLVLSIIFLCCVECYKLQNTRRRKWWVSNVADDQESEISSGAKRSAKERESTPVRSLRSLYRSFGFHFSSGKTVSSGESKSLGKSSLVQK